LRQPGANGVLEDASAGRPEVGLAVDRASGEATGEERAEPAVAVVEALRVVAEQALKAARELGLCAVEDEVVVRGQQAERMQRPAVAIEALPQSHQEESSVVVVAEDRAAVHATRHHVEVPVRERRAKYARHVFIKAPISTFARPVGRS
jgi:hypothetical protein